MDVQKISRQILINGLLLIMAGLVWGLMASGTPHPRLAVGAHVQFLTNGLLIVVLAVLLLKLPHQVGKKSAAVMLLATWLLWPMALSEVANAWWGTAQTLPIAAAQAGVMGGTSWQELVVKITHRAAGLCLVLAWLLLVVGFIRQPSAAAAR